MRLLKRTVTAVALVVGAPALLWAQETPIDPDNPVRVASETTGFGTVSGEFLQFGASARGMALGGGASTIVDDVSALHYNPANLVFLPGPQAALTVMPYFADTDYYWAGLAFPFSDNDFGMGVFLGRFGFGDQPIYTEADENGLSGETYNVNEVVAGVSFAHAFIDRFSAGATVKYITDDLAGGALAGARASTIAIDFGVNFHSELLDRPVALAFVVQNLGGTLAHSGDALRFRDFNQSGSDPNLPDQRVDPPFANYDSDAFPLPRLLRIGLNYDLITNEQFRLSMLGDFVESNNQKAQFSVGSELAWVSQDGPIGAWLRGSYTTQPDNDDVSGIGIEPDNEGMDGLAFGGGLFYRLSDRYRLQLDYAYRHFGALGSVDAFTFTIGWE
ncbi:MAG: PorV/PorQ family protein [Gemmatimonadota bacterium]